MVAITVNKDEFIRKCEEVYKRNKDSLEQKHYGKLVALYEDGVAGIGGTVDEAFKKAEKDFPNRIFYVRRVGKYSAAGILF